MHIWETKDSQSQGEANTPAFWVISLEHGRLSPNISLHVSTYTFPCYMLSWMFKAILFKMDKPWQEVNKLIGWKKIRPSSLPISNAAYSAQVITDMPCFWKTQHRKYDFSTQMNPGVMFYPQSFPVHPQFYFFLTVIPQDRGAAYCQGTYLACKSPHHCNKLEATPEAAISLSVRWLTAAGRASGQELRVKG